MGQQVYPTLAGIAYNVQRKSEFKTFTQRAASGRELRGTYQAFPLTTFQIDYEFLRNDGTFFEIQNLIGFFLLCQGSFDSFLFTDPLDNVVTNQLFALGDGVTTGFQLSRSFGAGGATFAEPVKNPVGNQLIYGNDWQASMPYTAGPRTNYTLHTRTMASAVGWGFNQCGVTDNSGTAPDGTNTAELITLATTTRSYVQCVNNTVQFANVTMTGSVSLLNGTYTGTYILMILDGAGVVEGQATFDLATQSITGVTGAVTPAIAPMPNGYWLCSLTTTYPSGATAGSRFRVEPVDSSANSGQTYYISDMQFENNSYAGRRILTSTAIVTVTDYTINNSGFVTFTNAPAGGLSLTWSGNYYYRCRFTNDTINPAQIMNQIWEGKGVEFVGAIGNRV